MNTALSLLGCMGAAAFFGLLFHAPGRCIFPASLIALAGYGLYLVTLAYSSSTAAAAFVASLLISALSELFARKLRAPATIFVSIAIIPLVPGGGLYSTMLAMIQNRLQEEPEPSSSWK